MKSTTWLLEEWKLMSKYAFLRRILLLVSPRVNLSENSSKNRPWTTVWTRYQRCGREIVSKGHEKCRSRILMTWRVWWENQRRGRREQESQIEIYHRLSISRRSRSVENCGRRKNQGRGQESLIGIYLHHRHRLSTSTSKSRRSQSGENHGPRNTSHSRSSK